MPESPSVVAAGQTILHYRLVEKLGEGGMGVVWKAIDTTLDRLTGWRHWIQTASRGRRVHLLLAREPSYDGTLRFALDPEMTIPDELRRIAPEAIADFERETGRREP